LFFGWLPHWCFRRPHLVINTSVIPVAKAAMGTRAVTVRVGETSLCKHKVKLCRFLQAGKTLTTVKTVNAAKTRVIALNPKLPTIFMEPMAEKAVQPEWAVTVETVATLRFIQMI
jgi:hypothetical protein